MFAFLALSEPDVCPESLPDDAHTCAVAAVLQKLGSSMQCEEGTEWLLELLVEVQLQQYFLRIRDDLNVTRLSHFDYVKNEDLEKIGMGRPGEELGGAAAASADLTAGRSRLQRFSCAHALTSSLTLSCEGQRRLWEAVKRRKVLCKRKSWMSKVTNALVSHSDSRLS